MDENTQIVTASDDPETVASSPDLPSGVTPEQVDQVVRWIVEGHAASDIERSIREQWPEADVSAVALAATGQLIESARITPEVVKGFCIEATREMYRRLVEMGEFAQALRAIRQLWEMTSVVKL